MTAANKELICEFKDRIRIVFLYTPGHRGSKGNIEADKLVKLERELTLSYKCKNGKCEFLPEIRRKILSEFERELIDVTVTLSVKILLVYFHNVVYLTTKYFKQRYTLLISLTFTD